MRPAGIKRRTTSCALCRRRKIKCDAKSWPCGPCKKAGVSCVGGDIDEHASNRHPPRSLVLWLEHEIASLEEKDAAGAERQHRALSQSEADYEHPGRMTVRDAITKDIRFPWLGLSDTISMPKFVLHSDAWLPSNWERTEQPEANPSLHEPIPRYLDHAFDPLQSIPRNVADFLLEVYITRAMPLYPIFYEPWLRSCHAGVIHRELSGGSPPSYDIFTISLIMAISLSTAARAKQARANDMAFKLFQFSLAHTTGIFTNDFKGLQALLVAQVYAVMNPAAANVDFLASYATQACIDMGLHREEPLAPGNQVDLLERDLKRRVLWTAWELDVSCSGGFARPVKLLPKYITTGYPSEMEDAAIHPSRIDPHGKPSKFFSGRIRRFRLIELEVLAVLFHGNAIPTEFSSLESWMDEVERGIHAWRRSVQDGFCNNEDQGLAAQWEEMAIFADIADPLVLVTLFRPSPRIKNPTAANLVKAFNASVEVARGYTKQTGMGFGSLKYTFQPCHHVFAAGMVFLHAIRECPTVLAATYTLEEMEGFMNAFPEYFDLAAERWPALASCKDEYYRLLAPVKEHYVNSLQLTTPESLPHMDELEEYLCQPDMWLPQGESTMFPPVMHDGVDQQTSEDWLSADLESIDWDLYFNLGST